MSLNGNGPPGRSDHFANLPVERSDYTTLESARPALRFGRFEYKYLIPDSARAHFEAVIAKFLQLDPNCAAASDSSYLVTSVYFDTRQLACYHEKQDGLLNRRKFRIRTYGPPASGLQLLEEKGRRNSFSYKNRARVPPDLAAACFAADWRRLAAVDLDQLGDPFPKFVASGVRNDLSPKVRVSYRRRAYVSGGGYRFRVTFDDQLTAAAAKELWSKPAFVRRAVPGRTIVEIKFEYQVPLWFIRLIESSELTRISVSKYCLCAEAIGLVQPDEPIA
jgi:VTC domain-containing protein